METVWLITDLSEPFPIPFSLMIKTRRWAARTVEPRAGFQSQWQSTSPSYPWAGLTIVHHCASQWGNISHIFLDFSLHTFRAEKTSNYYYKPQDILEWKLWGKLEFWRSAGVVFHWFLLFGEQDQHLYMWMLFARWCRLRNKRKAVIYVCWVESQAAAFSLHVCMCDGWICCMGTRISRVPTPYIASASWIGAANRNIKTFIRQRYNQVLGPIWHPCDIACRQAEKRNFNEHRFANGENLFNFPCCSNENT